MRLGVCSWSLKPNSGADLLSTVGGLGLDAIQLALDPFRTAGAEWDVAAFREASASAGIAVRSGMIGMRGEDYSTLESIRRTGGVRLDADWPENLANARRSAEIAQSLSIPLVTFHAGFLPERADDPARPVLLDRLRALHDVFAERGARVALETGQETADTLLAILADVDRPIGVNFDPANMLLYGMGDPVEALRRLAPRVAQIHIKDARPSAAPGQWGEDVVVGTGNVDFAALFALISAAGLKVDCMIERERGKARIEDIRAAIAHVRPLMESAAGRRA